MTSQPPTGLRSRSAAVLACRDSAVAANRGRERRQLLAGALLLAALSLTALFAGGRGLAAAETAPEPLANDLVEAWTGDLDGMVERRRIRVITTFSRTGFFLDGAQERGLTYELASALTKALNHKFKTKASEAIELIMVPVPPDQLFAALNQGLGDIVAANLTVTADRQALADFTAALRQDNSHVVATGPGSPDLASLDDLAGQTVHVRRSSGYWSSLAALNDDLQQRGLAAVVLAPADEHLRDEDLLELVASGALGLTVVDGYTGTLWGKVLKDLVLRSDLAVADSGDIAWAVRKGSPKLIAALNDFIGGLQKRDDLEAVLIRRYYDETKWIANPHETRDRKRFDQAAPFFKTYAAAYDFDWLMIAAQAYQESRIDQSARNPTGAVGIMQIKPETAGDKAVGIHDISSPENNIHAGVKYLRVLITTYLDDPALDPQNQLLMALAAYNAGPGGLKGLRKRAVKMGLDPNVWFGNVEHAAARHIGAETVTYVANIAKYYYAYRAAAEIEAARAQAKSAEQ